MLVVTVDLHSAVTGEKKNLGKIIIANDGGGTRERGNYFGRSYRAGTDLVGWHKKKPTRKGTVIDHPRLSAPVWNLVAKMLKEMGYGT